MIKFDLAFLAYSHTFDSLGSKSLSFESVPIQIQAGLSRIATPHSTSFPPHSLSFLYATFCFASPTYWTYLKLACSVFLTWIRYFRGTSFACSSNSQSTLNTCPLSPLMHFQICVFFPLYLPPISAIFLSTASLLYPKFSRLLIAFAVYFPVFNYGEPVLSNLTQSRFFSALRDDFEFVCSRAWNDPTLSAQGSYPDSESPFAHLDAWDCQNGPFESVIRPRDVTTLRKI